MSFTDDPGPTPPTSTSTDRVDWDRVRRGLERERHRMIWRPYGLPVIADPGRSAFVDADIAPKWELPPKLAISAAITGAFFTRAQNPSQPITPQEIYEEARASVLAGASTIHIHVRDDNGYNTLDPVRFREVILPLKEEFPDLAVDACMVCALDGEWEKMIEVLDSGLLDGVPINTTATYVGDALFAKPIPMILEKTRLIIESGAKPIIACYTDADVNNADRLLFKSELLGPGAYWLILPALPGCSPMGNPRQMFEGLLRMQTAILDVDPEASIVVCAAGRASSHLVTIAAALGLHIRVGMEDTIWRYPHRDDLIQSNVDMVGTAVGLASVLGREVATHSEYRELMGMPFGAVAAADPVIV
ncbi:MAG: 3-keto-5-aminohexanoate cleavage protein [Frankiales bacterium]|nr:3-keto-5-aminohexanoate cleavage protein [Frankiales bacterium]